MRRLRCCAILNQGTIQQWKSARLCGPRRAPKHCQLRNKRVRCRYLRGAPKMRHCQSQNTSEGRRTPTIYQMMRDTTQTIARICKAFSRAQDIGACASFQIRTLVHEKIAKSLALATPLQPPPPVPPSASLGLPTLLLTTSLSTLQKYRSLLLTPSISIASPPSTSKEHDLAQDIAYISPTAIEKRVQSLTSLRDICTNSPRDLNAYDLISGKDNSYFCQGGMEANIYSSDEKIEMHM